MSARRGIAALVCGLWIVAALAIDAGEAFPDAPRQERYLALVHELRCVVCQNQTIADSNADLAADLRHQVRDRIARGESDEDIKRYLTDRYGDFILYDPPWSARSAVLWVAPALLLVVALVVIGRVIRARSSELNQEESS